MSDQDDFIEENQVATPALGSNNTSVSSARFVGHRDRSDDWDHFTEEQSDGSKRQKFDKFDQEACQNELVKMFVATDIPISFVENEEFQKFLKVLQPKFSVSSLSQATLAHDILTLWDAERTKLQSFLAQHCGKICLSIDTWTSCRDQNYMCVTAHFIDNNWKLHKKILNFLPTVGRSLEYMEYGIEWCLNAWEPSRIFSLTVDNVPRYDYEIRCLKEKLMTLDTFVLKGDYIYMHPCAHILNMILKEALQNIDDSILRISDAVQYTRSSPSILSGFEACAEQEKIESEGYVHMDIETRWNLSYEMLEAALKHQRAFEDLELHDKKYVHELEKGKGVPTYEDWNQAYLMLPFLKIFHEAILRICNTSNATSNIYMLEVFGIGKKISQLCHSKDLNVHCIAIMIRRYYNQHWENGGRHDEFNMLLLIALVFDPRYKVGYINWMIDQIFNSVEAANLKQRLESCLKSLFEEYNDGEEKLQNDSQKAQFDEEGKEDPYSWNEFRQSHESSFKSELNKYLEEDTETSEDLDILNWWKLNSSRFPILANIAREALAMPVSTLTSECALGNNAKVLDSFCSYLNFDLMQALVCTHDWLYGKPFSLRSNKDLEKLKQEMVYQLDITCSTFTVPDD